MSHFESPHTTHLLTAMKASCDEEMGRVVKNINSFLDAFVSSNEKRPARTSASQSNRTHQTRTGASLQVVGLAPAEIVLRNIVNWGNEVIDTPLTLFLVESSTCQYLGERILAIRKPWDVPALWHQTIRSWYFQILLAFAKFSRMLKWARTDFLIGEAEESWDFFISTRSTVNVALEGPSKWYSKDPDKMVQGSWNPLGHAWESSLTDLPVRQQEEAVYRPLTDVKLSTVDLPEPFPKASIPPTSIKDFDIIRRMRSGASASVFLAKRKSNGDEFAIKVTKKADMFGKNQIAVLRAKRRVVLEQVASHFVNQLYFIFQSPTKVYLVKELLIRGDCASLIQLGCVPEEKTKVYVHQIVNGLEHLHNLGIIHRDLRPENVLICLPDGLKLTDFGLSQSKFLRRSVDELSTNSNVANSNSQDHKIPSAVYYLTPQVVLGLQDDDVSIDWWAVGIMTYEFLYGVTPFHANRLGIVFQNILSGKIEWTRGTVAPSLMARSFITCLLVPDPTSRLGRHDTKEVKTHQFLAGAVSHSSPEANADLMTTSRNPETKDSWAKFNKLFAQLKASQENPSNTTDYVDRPLTIPPSPTLTHKTSLHFSPGSSAPGPTKKRPGKLTLNRTRSDQESEVDLSPTSSRRRHTGGLGSGRSTPSSGGKSRMSPRYWRTTSSRNSSDGRGSSWLSAYTTSDSEEPSSSADSLFSPPPHSPRNDLKVPSYDLFSHQLILEELDLTGRVIKLDKYPFESGGVADIYRATLKASKSPVTVKIFRRMHFEPETLEKTSKYLYEEARIWSRLHHPNVLPFLGISLDLGLSPALISPFCASGSITRYLHQGKMETQARLRMAIGVALGLSYLHSEGIVHGNLCTKKVLVDGNGSPVICGYGMSKTLRQPTYTTSLFSSPIRFASPESFSVKGGTHPVRTESGDTYAFSMVALEIMSGLEPYHHLPTEYAVFIHIVRGGRPVRSHLDQLAVTNRMWKILTSLWNKVPSLRPKMTEVVKMLTRMKDSGDEEDDTSLDVESNEPTLSEKSEKDERSSSSSGEETSFGDPSFPETHSRDLKRRVVQDDQYPFAGGGNSNIYRGKLTRSDGRKIRVAIKMIRISDDGSGQLEEILRRLKREIEVWSRLKHKNLLPFIGVCDDIAPWPVLVSPFYKFGHVGAYLKKNPNTNRQDIVCGIASGLQYLHARDVIHGDLKVQNVLVDKRGAPCICDFGISKILNRSGFTTSSVGTAPYMAPELFFVLDGANQEPVSPSTTKSSDVYSFALLVLEILTLEPPRGRPTRPIVTAEVLSELRPKREDYNSNTITGETWAVLDRCWAFEPDARPVIFDVFRELSSAFKINKTNLEELEEELEYMDL
ncbi:kinase-like domain-containing protein [Mycena sp. CBHHK59/15]|nr:kinase-like domain-containing protein [Mycena sp. CBHHK59/15]